MSQGSRGGRSESAGDGSYTARGLANSKRQYLHVPTDEEIVRQFGSKNPRIVHRRTIVSELLRGGSNLIQIQELVNQDIAEQNAKLVPLGVKPLKPVSMATIRKDAQFVKQATLARWLERSHLRVAEMFDALELTVIRNEQLYQRGAMLLQQAKSWEDKLQASHFQRRVNAQNVDAVRSLLKALGLSDKIDVNIRQTPIEGAATVPLSGAPPSVVVQRERQRFLDGQEAGTQIEGRAEAVD